MISKLISVFVTITAILFALSSCTANEPPFLSQPPVWYTQNIDSSFETRAEVPMSPDRSARRRFQIYANDPNGTRDIDRIEVQDPDNNRWILRDLDAAIDHYDSSGGFWGTLYYSDSDIPHSLLLGEYTVSVKDRSGLETTDTFTVTLPGQDNTGGKDYIYSEDLGSPPANSEPMLKRASITARSKGGTISIDFNVDDADVSQVCVWFYDNSDNFVVATDYESVINNSGSNNNLSYSVTDLGGASNFSSAYGFHVILIDGAQYGDTEWDHQSISAYDHF